MKKFLRPLLLIAALLFAQHAAMLHGLTHAGHDIAVAQNGKGKAPALDHGTHVCAAFGALAHALGDFSVPSFVAFVPPAATPVLPPALAVVARFAFDSRAPPLSA
jgi:hypothetical protein